MREERLRATGMCSRAGPSVDLLAFGNLQFLELLDNVFAGRARADLHVDVAGILPSGPM